MALNIGDLLRLSAAFTDPNSNDDPVDPSGVIVTWKDPAGTITSKTYITDAEVVRDSLGNFHIDVNIDQAGEWSFEWKGTGTGQAAEEMPFVIVSKVTV